MSMKMLNFLRLFCCILVLVLSAKSKENEENSGEEDKNLLEDINEVLIELKATIVENKLHRDKADVLHDQQIQQLLTEQNRSKEREDALKVEINHINEVLSEFMGKTNSSILIKLPEICNRSLDEFYEHQKPDYTWVITDLHRKLKQRNFEMLSEVFPLRGYSFGAQVELWLFNEHLFFRLSFKKENESAEALQLETLPAVAFTFKNHSENHHGADSVTRRAFRQFNETFRYDAFSGGIWLILLDRNGHSSSDLIPKYKVNDTVSIDIHVEPPEWSQQACSHDGTLTWAIEDYSKKLKKERDLRLFYQVSPYFYTSPKGFRMVVYFTLDSSIEIRQKGLTAFLTFVDGPNDHTLDPSFSFRTTVTLLHPTDPTKHIARSVDERGIIHERPWPTFVYMGSDEEIEPLVVNDTLHYNVTVVEIRNAET